MDTRSRINNSSKIRVLVTHNNSKFLVLINPTRSIRELKEEILKIYDFNTGTPSNVSIDGLQLLAYDGFALCDQFVISDALYDGCLLNTSPFEMDNRTTLIDCPPVRSPSLVHIPLSGKATLVPTVIQRPPLIHPQTCISTDHSQTVTSTIQSPPVLPPVSTPCVSQSSLMTPSTLTDLPSSQPDEEDTQNIVTLQKSTDMVAIDKHPQYIPAQSLMNVYEFPIEDSENPLATGGKKKTNNKRQKTNKTVKKTPRSKKSKKVTVSVDEDSEFEPPKQYVRKRPPPKQKDVPVKKRARKVTSDVPVTNTVSEELSSSWSSIENDNEQETNKNINDGETQMSDEAENSFEIPVVGDLPSQQQKNTDNTITSDNTKAITTTTIDATTNDTPTNTASDTVITDTSTSNTATTTKITNDAPTTTSTSTNAKPATNINTIKTKRKRNGSNNVESSKATVIESTAIDDIVSDESQRKKQRYEQLLRDGLAGNKHKPSSSTMKHKSKITSINKSNTDVQSPKKNSSQSSDKKSTAVLSPVIIKHSNSKLSSVKRTTVVQQPAPARGTKKAKNNSGDPPSVDDGVSLSLKSTKNIEILSSTVVPSDPLSDNNDTPKKQINNSNSNKSNIVLNSKDTNEKDEEVNADNDSTSEERSDDESDNVMLQTNSSASDGEEAHGDEVNEVSDSEGEEQPTSERNIQVSQLSSVKKSAIVQQPISSQVRKNIINRSTPSANTKGNNGSLKSARNKDLSTIVQDGGGPLSDSNKPVNNNTLKKHSRNDSKNEEERNEQDKDQTTDASSSSSDDDGSDTDSDIIPSGQTTTHNKPSKSLQALATDADDTQRNVRMKSVNLLPPNSNVRKRLLAKTSLIKKIPLSVEKNKHKSFTSLSVQQPKQVKPTLLKKKLRISKTPAALEGISREEEEMAFNMSQESSANLSKIFEDETLW